MALTLPPFSLVTTVQVLNLSVCVELGGPPSPLWLYRIPNYALTAALFILAIFQTLKESFYEYKATQRWQANQYLKLLARDGIWYFLV
jgi:ABC-type sugar transport system permease subunit